MADVRVGLGGIALRGSPEERRQTVAAIAGAGVDHVMTGDHVSFFVGIGFDGLISAASILSLHDTLPVHVGIYLLPLRHPVLVARQLSDLAALAPGRLVFGVGVGGEDRHEIEVCGVDPRTRGRRTNESLEVLRGLLTGQPVTHHGEFFDLDSALIVPAPAPPVPILVGGRSDAAVERAARFGDGWLGIWVSPTRYGAVTAQIATIAGEHGRGGTDWRHEMQLWCGFGPTREEARAVLAPAMQSMYQMPFEPFEKYSPYGTAENVAEFLSGYVDAGCRSFNLIAVGGPTDELAGQVAEVKNLLSAS